MVYLFRLLVCAGRKTPGACTSSQSRSLVVKKRCLKGGGESGTWHKMGAELEGLPGNNLRDVQKYSDGIITRDDVQVTSNVNNLTRHASEPYREV